MFISDTSDFEQSYFGKARLKLWCCTQKSTADTVKHKRLWNLNELVPPKEEQKKQIKEGFIIHTKYLKSIGVKVIQSNYKKIIVNAS